jgi:predicted nucleotidyltransferase
MSGKESKDPMDKGEIKEILAADMAYLSREYGVERIGLFGSYVRNEQRSDSDIDLLVEFDLLRGKPRRSRRGRIARTA